MYFNLIPEFIVSARYLSNRFIGKCHEEGLHYVFLDTEWEPLSFELSRSVEDEPGTITLIRTEAPIDKSRCWGHCRGLNGTDYFRNHEQ